MHPVYPKVDNVRDERRIHLKPTADCVSFTKDNNERVETVFSTDGIARNSSKIPAGCSGPS